MIQLLDLLDYYVYQSNLNQNFWLELFLIPAHYQQNTYDQILHIVLEFSELIFLISDELFCGNHDQLHNAKYMQDFYFLILRPILIKGKIIDRKNYFW